MGWTSAENVVVVRRDGSMAVYDIRGEHLFTRVITRASLSVCLLSVHCLSICPFVYLFVCLSVCLSVCTACLFLCLTLFVYFVVVVVVVV